MIYIISEYGDNTYKIFETKTESTLMLAKEKLIEIIKKYNLELKNAGLFDAEIVLNNWPHDMLASGHNNYYYDSIILTNTADNKVKVYTPRGVYKISVAEVQEAIPWGKSEICGLIHNAVKKADGTIAVADTYKTVIDEEFNRQIKTKNDVYIAKCKLLGVDKSFEYEIDGHEVILTRYKSKSDTVSIPPFITAIGKDVFKGLKSERVSIGDSVRYIQDGAFAYSEITELVLNKELKIIGESAFEYAKVIKYVNTDNSNNILDLREIRIRNTWR